MKVDEYVEIMKMLNKIHTILDCTTGILIDLKEYRNRLIELEKRLKELEDDKSCNDT